MKQFALYCMLLGVVLIFGGCNEKERSGTVDVKPAPPAKKVKPAGPEFFDYALNGNIKAVQTQLLDGVNVNSQNPDQRTALMFAAFNGHTDIAALLISRGAGVNMKDNIGRGALMFAASGPNNDTVKLLLEKDADVNSVELQEKWTALMFAAAEGQTAVVKTLLDNKADWKLKDIDGDTARDFAKKNGHTQTMELIDKFFKTQPGK